jgi:hypothetical protein
MLVLLLTALLQGAAAILALVLTANVVFAQLQPYQLPAQYLTLWDRQTTWMYGLLGASTLWPAVIVMLDAYSLTWTAVALFAVTIALLGLYIRFRPRSVVLDRFFDEMVTHPALRREAATDIHQMCLSAMERSDFETFRRSCLVLFSIDEGSDRVYRLWNDLLSRTPDEPAAFTPVSEALYVCGSPLAEAQDIAAPSTMATRPRGSMPANPLYSSVLSEHAPTYFARLQLMTESLDWGRRRLVRQEVVENMLLLLLDLLTLPDDHPLVKESRVEPSVAALLAHLEEAEEAALLPAFGGDGVYHHQLFTLPYDGRLNPRQREDLAERRRCAWNRVVGHLYHERHWRDQSHLRVAVWRDGDGSPQVLTDGDAVEAIAGGPGDDGLRCEHSLMGGGARL